MYKVELMAAARFFGARGHVACDFDENSVEIADIGDCLAPRLLFRRSDEFGARFDRMSQRTVDIFGSERDFEAG